MQFNNSILKNLYLEKIKKTLHYYELFIKIIL